MRKKLVLSILGASLIISSSLAVGIMLEKKQTSDNITSEIVNGQSVTIKKINSYKDESGNSVEVFSYKVLPEYTADKTVIVLLSYEDGSEYDNAVTSVVDKEQSTISLTCLKDFGTRIIAKVAARIKPDVYSEIYLDYQKKIKNVTYLKEGDYFNLNYNYLDYISVEYTKFTIDRDIQFVKLDEASSKIDFQNAYEFLSYEYRDILEEEGFLAKYEGVMRDIIFGLKAHTHEELFNLSNNPLYKEFLTDFYYDNFYYDVTFMLNYSDGNTYQVDMQLYWEPQDFDHLKLPEEIVIENGNIIF